MLIMRTRSGSVVPECDAVDEAWAAASSSVLFVAPADKLGSGRGRVGEGLPRAPFWG